MGGNVRARENLRSTVAWLSSSVLSAGGPHCGLPVRTVSPTRRVTRTATAPGEEVGVPSRAVVRARRCDAVTLEPRYGTSEGRRRLHDQAMPLVSRCGAAKGRGCGAPAAQVRRCCFAHPDARRETRGG